MAAADTCFHCALPIPANCDIRVDIGGESRPVCCPGCQAVATLIRDAGFERYYDSRERPEPGAVRPAEDAGGKGVGVIVEGGDVHQLPLPVLLPDG